MAEESSSEIQSLLISFEKGCKEWEWSDLIMWLRYMQAAIQKLKKQPDDDTKR